MTSPEEEARRQKEREEAAKGCLWATLAVMALAVAGCWYFLSTLHWSKGRPLRGRRDWSRKHGERRPALREDCTPEELAARHWRAMASEEYESIAAFSELSLDLMAAGAPLELVTACHRAALEEERHTRVCLDIAARLSGVRAELEPVARLRVARKRPSWRGALLVRLALESYFDGWIGEASTARVLAAVAREVRDPALRKALRNLAREEIGHARLGRSIVRWCTLSGGPLVDRALELARRHAARSWRGSPEEVEGLRHFGVPDARLRARALEAARAAAGITLA